MIIHVFPKEKFTVGFVNFINKHFSDNNFFLIYGENKTFNEEEIKQYNNIRYIDTRDDIWVFDRYLKGSDKIILHSLFLKRWMMLYLALNKKILKKSNWVVWGGDLYQYKYKEKNLKNNFDEKIRRIVIKNLGGLITHIKGDYYLAKKWYKIKGEYIYSFMYPSNIYKPYNSINKKNNNTIYIQVGNSASPTNGHLEIFDKLKKYSHMNIKIICPLSYGDEDNRERIIKYGQKLFSDKFEAITKFMSLNEYLDLLRDIDIAIFNHSRQQAVGNITNLLGLGKKVYIRSDITTWNFCEDHNLKVFDVNNGLEDIFEEFSLENKTNNIKNVLLNFSEEKLIDNLKEILK